MEMQKNDANGQSVLNFNAGFFGPASALAPIKLVLPVAVHL